MVLQVCSMVACNIAAKVNQKPDRVESAS
jgi:hypothetical protein